MNSTMECSTTLVAQDGDGWHMRPIALLVNVAKRFEAEIVVKCGEKMSSAKSLLGLLSLGADRDGHLHVSARGRDASRAIHAIKNQFSCPETGSASQSHRDGH